MFLFRRIFLILLLRVSVVLFFFLETVFLFLLIKSRAVAVDFITGISLLYIIISLKNKLVRLKFTKILADRIVAVDCFAF